MQNTTIGAVVVGGVLMLVTAACGSSSGGAATGATAGGAPSGGGTSASTVSVSGGVLVDAQDRALYETEQESDGTLRCTGPCAKVWIPVVVSGQPSAGAGATGTVGTVARSDGQRQVTYDGIPLYAFSFDTQAGQVTGDGTKDSFGGTNFTWHAVRPGGTSPAPSSGSGGGGGYGY